MDRHLELLTIMLLDPCLTADEAAREAAARVHSASARAALAAEPSARAQRRADLPEANGPPVGF